ncbi:MAG: hypothetical protein HZA49_01080 [Planctomycetes bacterium]|nr:hypothetical protein [Planctomycetota bacterium]
MKKIIIFSLIFMLSFFIFLGISSCLNNNNSDSGSSGELYLYAPGNLVVTATSATSITMSWTDNTDNEIGFYVECATPTLTYSLVATLTADTTAFTHTTQGAITPTANNTYYYRVRAYSYVTTSDYSNVAGTLTSWDTTLADATAPASRTNHTALWAPPYGILFWGGYDGQKTLNTGAVYSPTANTWSNITLTGAPSSRTGHSAIWTGSKMIIWGGYTISSVTQTIDNCDSNWTGTTPDITATLNSSITKEGTSSISIAVDTAFTTGVLAYRDLPSPLNISARTQTSFWIRASQNIQPGVLSFLIAVTPTVSTTVEDLTINTTLNAGAWTLVTLNFTNPALLTDVKSIGLKAVSDPGAVTILIDNIEASGASTTYYNDGGIYDPSGGGGGSWSAVATTNAPNSRAFHSAVWTGDVMIIWGGKAGSAFNTGGVYDPVLDEWRTSSELTNLRNGTHANTPSIRSKHMAFWTGPVSGTDSWRMKMIVWGGDGGGTSGGIYDIAYDIWTPMATTNAPSQRWGFSSVWTGEGSETYNKKIIIWGGYNGTAPLGDGAIYNPAANTWATLSTTNAPSARMYHSGIWTGNKMFIWGGDGVLQSGGAYDPVYAIWGPITANNAPAARLYHSGTWTGTEMIVWGGYNGVNYFNSGGKYKIE